MSTVTCSVPLVNGQCPSLVSVNSNIAVSDSEDGTFPERNYASTSAFTSVPPVPAAQTESLSIQSEQSSGSSISAGLVAGMVTVGLVALITVAVTLLITSRRRVQRRPKLNFRGIGPQDVLHWETSPSTQNMSTAPGLGSFSSSRMRIFGNQSPVVANDAFVPDIPLSRAEQYLAEIKAELRRKEEEAYGITPSLPQPTVTRAVPFPECVIKGDLLMGTGDVEQSAPDANFVKRDVNVGKWDYGHRSRPSFGSGTGVTMGYKRRSVLEALEARRVSEASWGSISGRAAFDP